MDSWDGTSFTPLLPFDPRHRFLPGQMVRVRQPYPLGHFPSFAPPCSPYAADWPEVYIVTGVRWLYQARPAPAEQVVMVEIATADEIARGYGSSEFLAEELEPA